MDRTFSPAHRGGSGPPLVCLHGFTDTWRTWELVLPALERRHDVLAVTLAGHAGGPALDERVNARVALADSVERAMDEAGFETADIAGNSLGGYVSLELAARGRARSVVALAPAGGWAEGDDSLHKTLRFFTMMQELTRQAAPHADAIVASRDGRRRATEYIATNFEHIPSRLIAHQIRGAAGCDGAAALIECADREGYPIEAEKVTCPVRIVWGMADRILPWPAAALRYRDHLFPNADWVELDGVGHCPQLDVPVETAQLIVGFTSP